MLQLPAHIGKYELTKFLGGGMSHVYRAQDTVLGRTVAIKILTEEGCVDEDTKNRFLAEARMSSVISHDNIIRMHDYGEFEGKPYIVMEYLTGLDLRDAIRNNSTGDLRTKVNIALQVARALEHIHSLKIVHRDIKPENIHLDPSGRARLMDFGIAKSEGLSMTKTGLALGTPYYMSPEQVLGQPVTELVDVYAFGILLYELLTGLKPVMGDTVERLFYIILHEPLDLSKMQEMQIPEGLQSLVARCTAKNPAERIPNFTLISRELEAFLRHADSATVAMPVGVAGPSASISGGRPATQPPSPFAMPATKEPEPARQSTPPPPPTVEKSGSSGLVLGGLIALLVLGGLGFAAYRFLPHGTTTNGGSGGEQATALSLPSGNMVLVPAGAFLFGEKKESVTLPAFYIDQTEVTNGAYAQFCQAKKRPLPPDLDKAHPSLPVVNVSFIDAQEFAKWAGKRMPTEQEWEKAARGEDGRIYSWGNQQEPARANVADNPSAKGALMPADSFPNGASPYHALNLTGNVWEYVDELRTPSDAAVRHYATIMNPTPTAREPWYIIKGGSFDRKLADGVAYEWSSFPARHFEKNVGFRCAKTP